MNKLATIYLIFTVLLISGCDSGEDTLAINAAVEANACQVYKDIQLAEIGQPNEIRTESFGFADGSTMEVEEHWYTEERIIHSYGYVAATGVCSTWVEGITL